MTNSTRQNAAHYRAASHQIERPLRRESDGQRDRDAQPGRVEYTGPQSFPCLVSAGFTSSLADRGGTSATRLMMAHHERRMIDRATAAVRRGLPERPEGEPSLLAGVGLMICVAVVALGLAVVL